MPRAPQLVDVDAASCGGLPCCGIKSPVHPGRCEKLRWLEAQARFGVRAKVLLAPGGEPAGYIEYVPGESAWRGVDAGGYLFLHCVWVHSKRYQHRGFAGFLVENCVEEARKSGRYGVAAMARESPWMAGRALFLANGFEAVDSAPPDYELLVRKFETASPNPRLRGDWERKVAQYGGGFTIIRASQCPYIHKFTSEIAEAARKEYGLRPGIVELQSAEEAQNAPTPYAVFSIIYEGRVLADHPISCTRFRNIMNKLTGSSRR